MLNINKSITITGTITVKDGEHTKQVVYLNANISTEDGSDSVSQTVQDKALYTLHKEEIRSDIEKFTEEIYAIQDTENPQEIS